ncbi:MAG: Hsp70 family protein [Mycoplasmoidaceae bacterium]
MKDELIIGIDLGTTNSAVAVAIDGKPFVIANEEGKRTIPSIVYIENGKISVGDEAKALLSEDKDVVFSIKRLMGTKEKVHLDGKDYSPEQISGLILQYIKNRSERDLNAKISKAVITVPAYFDDGQRQATINAGKIAGLEVLRIINEPTAAAVAYGLDRKEANKDLKVLVYDLGGGTFDVSVLHLRDGLFEVLSTSGDNLLGGDDWDNKITDLLFSKLVDGGEKLDRESLHVKNTLKAVSEKLKIDLSLNDQITVDLALFNRTDLNFPYSKVEFEELTKDLMERTIFPVEDALREAKLEPKDVDKVLLVGGSTKMPMIQKYVRDLFGDAVETGVNPDEVVALGAAVQGAILKGDVDIELQDVIPLTIGIETHDGLSHPLLPRNSKVPAKKTGTFTTSYDDQDNIEINIVQGERKFAKDNRPLSEFVFDKIAKGKAGVPKIKVTYEIDMNGVLNVSARDDNTGREVQVVVKDTSGLSSSEISKMITEAQRFKQDDIQKLKNIEMMQIVYDYLQILVAYMNQTPYDLPPYYKRERSMEWVINVEKWITDKDYETIRQKAFAFMLHVNISLYYETKKGMTKLGFKSPKG